MQVAGMLLGCLLLAPVSDGRNAHSSEIVAEAMQLPAGSAIAGQQLTLLAALGSTPDRGQQLKIVRAYWRLVQAAGEYTFCRDHVKALERIKPGVQGDASLRLATTAATAQLREAELGAVRAQYELAELARLPAGSPPPLPADRPLVVPYDTKFKDLFAGRTPPEAARLSDRILPIQRQAIEDRAAAVQAADDSLAAVAENYQSNRGDAAAVVACSRELLRQQRAFIETVCAYNRNIADYALTVMGPATSPQGLVSVLIGPPLQTDGSSGLGDERPVRAAGANEPTLAPTRPPKAPTDGWKSNEPQSRPVPDPLKPVDKNEPPLTPPQAEQPVKPPVTSLDSLAPTPRTANKPIRPPVAMGDASGSAAATLYPALVAAMPAARAKQLAVTIYRERSLPEGFGKPIGLADCLLRDGERDHRATIEAYWLVCQRAAQYQLCAEQAELLDALAPAVSERPNEPSGATDSRRLRSAQLAARATVRDSQAALVEAQYGLALRIGALADAVWPLASTVPHTGGLSLKLDAQPRALAESWPVRRLAAMMPGLCESVRQRAAAVVDADAARAAAAEKYTAGAGAIDRAIEGVAAQTEQSTAFLDAIAAYNRAIAEYATTVLPPGTPADKLAAALVIKP